MDFDPLHVHIGDCFAGLQHHFARFDRQPVDDVRADADVVATAVSRPPRMKQAVSWARLISFDVSLVDRLQPELQP